MVRDAQAKIVVDHAHDTGELYDLTSDPGEHVNRWDDPAMVSTKCSMLTRLTHRMAGTVDPLPERLAPW